VLLDALAPLTSLARLAHATAHPLTHVLGVVGKRAVSTTRYPLKAANSPVFEYPLGRRRAARTAKRGSIRLRTFSGKTTAQRL